MILSVVDISQIVKIIAWISLAILVFIILYRVLISRLKRGSIEKELYLVLHPVEKEPASGVVQVFIEMDSPMEVEFSLFSKDGSFHEVLEHRMFKKGGNVIQLDTRKYENGIYFYQAKTHNQKTKKLMYIVN